MELNSSEIQSFVHLALKSNGFEYAGSTIPVDNYIDVDRFIEIDCEYIIYILGLLQDSVGCYAKLNGASPKEVTAFTRDDLDRVIYQTAKRVAKSSDEVLPRTIRQTIRAICPCDDSDR